jgi:hypothetical protein
MSATDSSGTMTEGIDHRLAWSIPATGADGGTFAAEIMGNKGARLGGNAPQPHK